MVTEHRLAALTNHADHRAVGGKVQEARTAAFTPHIARGGVVAVAEFVAAVAPRVALPVDAPLEHAHTWLGGVRPAHAWAAGPPAAGDHPHRGLELAHRLLATLARTLYQLAVARQPVVSRALVLADKGTGSAETDTPGTAADRPYLAGLVILPVVDAQACGVCCDIRAVKVAYRLEAALSLAPDERALAR